MSDEIKPKENSFEFPMMPIFGVDIGRELGALDSRMTRLETDVMEIKRDIKSLAPEIRRDIEAGDDKLGQEIKALESTLGQEIKELGDNLRQEIKAGDDNLRQEIKSLESTLRQEIKAVEDKLGQKIKSLEDRIKAVDDRVDKCLVAISRQDERINALAEGLKSTRAMIAGLYVAIIAGIIIQLFIK